MEDIKEQLEEANRALEASKTKASRFDENYSNLLWLAHALPVYLQVKEKYLETVKKYPQEVTKLQSEAGNWGITGLILEYY